MRFGVVCFIIKLSARKCERGKSCNRLGLIPKFQSIIPKYQIDTLKRPKCQIDPLEFTKCRKNWMFVSVSRKLIIEDRTPNCERSGVFLGIVKRTNFCC